MATAEQTELRARQENRTRAVQTALALLGNPRENVEVTWTDAKGVTIGNLDIPAAVDGKPRMPQGKEFVTIGQWCTEEHPAMPVLEDNRTETGKILIPQLQSLRETVMSAIGTVDAEGVALTIGGDRDPKTRLQITLDQISVSTKWNDPEVGPLESFANARICQGGDAELSVTQRSLGTEEENVGETIYFPIDTELGKMLLPSLEGIRGLNHIKGIIESIFPGAFASEATESTTSDQ
jgi:hypothetical protein